MRKILNLKIQKLILTLLLLTSLTMHLIYGIEGAAQIGALEYKIRRQATIIQDKQELIEIYKLILEGN